MTAHLSYHVQNFNVIELIEKKGKSILYIAISLQQNHSVKLILIEVRRDMITEGKEDLIAK